jgi:hypothetical protein
MKLFAILTAICLLSSSALAETQECKTIPDAAARLACYDKPVPPAASASKSVVAKPAAAMPARAPAAKTDTSKYVDTISAEDARMNAHLKNICRGC